MQDNESKDLTKQIHALNKEIIELRNRLNQADNQKEKAFSQKNSISRQIKELIDFVKVRRVERNKLTDAVQEEKKSRSDFNNKIKIKIEEIKALKSQIKPDEKKSFRESPSNIKSLMNKLNEKIETEVMSFDKEQKIMKQIKGLKKKYDEFSRGNDLSDKVHKLSEEIDALKATADLKHREIQEKAKSSQEIHEKILEVSKKIEELKKEEEKFADEFSSKKKEFFGINSKLKEKLSELTSLNKKVFVKKKSANLSKYEKDRNTIKAKQEAVQEKLRKGEKLTTEDILVLQSD